MINIERSWPVKIVNILIFLFMIYISTHAQDITNVKKSKPVTIGGGFNYSASGYTVSGMNGRLDPFSWSLGANLNINLYGIIDLPFSFNYSQGNKTFGQPDFNQFGMSPKYKYITVHAGYRSMQLSNYTLSGIMFLGGGVEIAPEKSLVKGAFMFGKFAKAVPYDTLKPMAYSNNLFDTPGYERWGYGGKLTVGKEEQNATLSLFRAWDKPGSIPDPVAESLITPKENLVIGLNGTSTVYEKIRLTGEIALSALTRDVRMPRRNMETFTYVNNMGGIFTPRESSETKAAYSFGAGYQGDIWNWEVAFKRVDPGFESLGTTYLTNDIQDYTVRIGRSFLENKVTAAVNSGIQRNNLDNQLKVTNKRFIGGVDFSWSVNDKLSLSGNFSNFNASTKPSAITIVDTFKYAQVTDNYMLTGNYNFGDNNKRHTINANFMYQIVNTLNETAVLVMENGTELFNTNIAYTISYVPISLNLTSSASYNMYIMGKEQTQAYGPSVGASKTMMNKKLRVSVNVSLLNNVAADKSSNWMNILKSSANYKIGKSHNFQLSVSYMNKKIPARKEVPEKSVHELKGSFTYAYTFTK